MRDFVSKPKGKYTGLGGGGVEENIFEVRGGWRKLRNEEVPNSYSPNNVIWKNKFRRIKLAGYVTRNFYLTTLSIV
jgi:hypothetical protein